MKGWLMFDDCLWAVPTVDQLVIAFNSDKLWAMHI